MLVKKIVPFMDNSDLFESRPCLGQAIFRGSSFGTVLIPQVRVVPQGGLSPATKYRYRRRPDPLSHPARKGIIRYRTLRRGLTKSHSAINKGFRHNPWYPIVSVLGCKQNDPRGFRAFFRLVRLPQFIHGLFQAEAPLVQEHDVRTFGTRPSNPER